MAKQYDRSAEDLGNIVGLEHVNLLVPDQGLATLFYVSGLGLTRDPYLMTSVDNMWINVGKSQFHLPTGKAQRLRGRTALVIPDRELLLKRLREHEEAARAARSSPSRSTTTTSRRSARGATSSSSTSRRTTSRGMVLGMPYVEFDVPKKAAKGIADFYSKVLGTMTSVKDHAAHVSVGYGQELIFRETDKPLAGLRRPSHPGLCRELLQAAQGTGRAQDPHRGEQPVPVPLQRPRRSGDRQEAVRDRARDPQHHPSALCAAAW